MFTASEWALILRGLEMSAASARRLSNREGQPAEVQAAYVKAMKEIADLSIKVQSEAAKVKK